MYNKDLCLIISLGDNTGNDSETKPNFKGEVFNTKMITEKDAWDQIVDRAKEKGITTLVIDLADGINYKSHPELWLKEGGWTPEYMTEEVKRLKSMGFKVIPMLNFSAAHDAWLGVYGRMLGTPDYREVVKDLIYEVCDIFETPELFHLGMNNEDEESQRNLTYACYRQFDLLMEDLNFMFKCVRDKGVRPWIWGDAPAKDFDRFEKNIAKDVLVSPYYFNHMFSDPQAPLIDAPDHVNMRDSYKKLTEAGYEILPCGSNHSHNWYSFEHNVRFSQENAVWDKVAGFMTLSGRSVTERNKYRYFAALEHVAEVKAKFLD